MIDTEDDDDPLAPARGVFNAVLGSAALWAALFLCFWVFG
jgi:hypothetical protein